MTSLPIGTITIKQEPDGFYLDGKWPDYVILPPEVYCREYPYLRNDFPDLAFSLENGAATYGLHSRADGKNMVFERVKNEGLAQ